MLIDKRMHCQEVGDQRIFCTQTTRKEYHGQIEIDTMADLTFSEARPGHM
jgi:hypothetical protein